MKFLFLLLFSSLSLAATAQKLPDFGLHQVRIADSDKTVRAELIPVNSQPKARPQLLYYWYASNMIHQLQGGYSGQLLNGSYTEYYLTKNLKTQGNFALGLKNGTWKEWSEKATLLTMITWDKGVKSGPFSIFGPSGSLIESGYYADNKREGKILFYAGGDSVKTVWYKKGKEIPAPTPLLQKINIFKKKSKSDKPHA